MTTTTVSSDTVFQNGGKTLISIENTNFNILYAANTNGLTKVLKTDHPEDEPDFVDSLADITSLKSVSDSKFIMTNLDGDAWVYDSKNPSQSKLLVRTALPLRDCELVHAGNTAIFGGDDLELSMVNLEDAKKSGVIKINEQVHQLSYNSSTNLLAISLVNGNIHFYSLSSAQPNQVKQLNGHITKVTYRDTDLDPTDEDEDEDIDDKEFYKENRISTRVAWSTSGQNFAIPCQDMTIKVFTLKNYSEIKTLKNINTSTNFIDVQFDSLDGDYVAAIDLQNRLTVWNWKLNEIVFERQLKSQVTNMVWKTRSQDVTKKLDILVGTWTGSIITIQDVAKAVLSKEPSNVGNRKGASLLDSIAKTKKTNQGLFVDSDDEDDIDGLVNSEEEDSNDLNIKPSDMMDNMAHDDGNEQDEDDDDMDGLFSENENPKKRKLHNDDDDDAIDDDEEGDGMVTDENRDGFIEDDDGAGYVSQRRQQIRKSNNKRSTFPTTSVMAATRFNYKPISPGGTPFGSGGRRYLTMNTIGYVSTVQNNEQYSITVSFFDTGKFNEYHFEDLFGFDVCYLSDVGTLFAQSKNGQLQYKPHDSRHSTWTKTIPLSRGEIITAIATTPKRVIVGTSYGYVRVFNQFGVVISVEKMSPVVAVTAYDYRVFLVHFSQYHGISFSLFEQINDKTVYFHRESSLPIPLPQNSMSMKDGRGHLNFNSFNPMGIKSLFFSEYGDPCIFGKDDVLLVLNKWRKPRESRWVPLLDARMGVWQISGGKDTNDVHVWPLGLANNTFSCIFVKGKHIWPGFPLPLPVDMELRIPILVKKQLWENHLEKKRERNERKQEEGIIDDVDDDKIEDIEIPVELKAEEESVRAKVLSDLLTETIENEGEMYGNEGRIVAALNSTYDKAILRLLAAACSSQNAEKALSLVQELKQEVALNAAAKIAERAEMMTLMKRINDMREARFEEQMNAM